MQTNLADFIRGTPDGDTADAILNPGCLFPDR